MNKKSIAIFALLAVVTAGLVSPAFAQGQQPSGNPGFFGMFTSFFSKMFGGQNNNQNAPQGDVNNPSGTPSAMPSGVAPSGQTDGQRLQGLVTAGKITQAQEQQILAEITKIKSEISSWSTSTGIDAGYVYGGLRGPGMSAGIGGGAPSGVQPSGTQGKPNQGGRPQGNGMMGGPRGQQ